MVTAQAKSVYPGSVIKSRTLTRETEAGWKYLRARVVEVDIVEMDDEVRGVVTVEELQSGSVTEHFLDSIFYVE